MIAQNKKIELKYWKHKNKSLIISTYSKFFEIVPIELFKNCLKVADIGSGAYGGIFNAIKFPVMIAVDPMWGEYTSAGLKPDDDSIIRLSVDSTRFIMTGLDCIFTINAIDHSGDFQQSIANLYDALKDGGLFAMHVHMRTNEQLDSCHKMVITDEDVNISRLGCMEKLFYQEYKTCPFGNGKKPIKTIIGVWKK